MHSEVLMYSSSIMEVDKVDCFLEFQYIGLLPIKIICPEIDFLSLVSPPKSKSTKAIILPIPL